MFLEPAQIPTGTGHAVSTHANILFPGAIICLTKGNSSGPTTFVSSYPLAEARCTGKSACRGWRLRSRSWSREGQAKEPSLLYMGTRVGVGPSPGSKSWA